MRDQAPDRRRPLRSIEAQGFELLVQSDLSNAEKATCSMATLRGRSSSRLSTSTLL
jgi:hypothetical protein